MSLSTYTATFDTYFTGTVAFNEFNGFTQMAVSLNASGASACTQNLFSYHIHETAPTSAGDCGSSSTGGHWIPNKDCNTTRNAFGNQESCEIGDLSCRFGKINTTGLTGLYEMTYDFPELYIGGLQGRSVVFHCADGATNPRVACAGFTQSTHSNSASASEVGNYYGVIGENFGITMADGQLMVAARNLTGWCAEPLSYHIHQKWEGNNGTEAYGANDCGPTNTGGHYDPFLACGGASEYAGTDYCGCGTYTCNTSYANTYGCEVGDLSGAYGKVPSQEGDWNMTYAMNVLPPVGQSLSVVLHCGSTRVACAQLQAGPAPAPAPAPSPSPSPSPGSGSDSSSGSNSSSDSDSNSSSGFIAAASTLLASLYLL